MTNLLCLIPACDIASRVVIDIKFTANVKLETCSLSAFIHGLLEAQVVLTSGCHCMLEVVSECS